MDQRLKIENCILRQVRSHDHAVSARASQSDGQDSSVRHLTSGSWEVSEILAYDERTRSV